MNLVDRAVRSTAELTSPLAPEQPGGARHATLWFCRVGEMVAAIERSFERHAAFLAAGKSASA